MWSAKFRRYTMHLRVVHTITAVCGGGVTGMLTYTSLRKRRAIQCVSFGDVPRTDMSTSTGPGHGGDALVGRGKSTAQHPVACSGVRSLGVQLAAKLWWL